MLYQLSYTPVRAASPQTLAVSSMTGALIASGKQSLDREFLRGCPFWPTLTALRVPTR